MLARRTLQRHIAKLIDARQIKAVGEGRARRYFVGTTNPISVSNQTNQANQTDSFPAFIPLSADSKDILRYIDQPLEARKPVGYQRDFLEAYQPDQSWYLLYELTRVELLRDLYVWAYERSTQEYIAIRQDLAKLDPLRLAWRELLKQSIRQVVCQPSVDPLVIIQQQVAAQVPQPQQAAVKALMIEELRRLHEGVLARYGVLPSDFAKWKAAQTDGSY